MVNRKTEHRTKQPYNITPEDYDQLYYQQNQQCAICKGGPGAHKHLSVDHCHKSAKVRGLLCSKCNRALGYFNDDVEVLQSAIRYLESGRRYFDQSSN